MHLRVGDRDGERTLIGYVMHCSCGWESVARRVEQEAQRDHRMHAMALAAPAEREGGTNTATERTRRAAPTD